MTDINQTAFDRVARHLLTQGRKSKDVDGNCFYRGPDGCKCAIGALIADGEYCASLEGTNVTNESVYSAVVRSLGAHLSRRLLRVLQDLHDCLGPDEWRSMLEGTAHFFDLSPAVLDEFK